MIDIPAAADRLVNRAGLGRIFHSKPRIRRLSRWPVLLVLTLLVGGAIYGFGRFPVLRAVGLILILLAYWASHLIHFDRWRNVEDGRLPLDEREHALALRAGLIGYGIIAALGCLGLSWMAIAEPLDLPRPHSGRDWLMLTFSLAALIQLMPFVIAKWLLKQPFPDED